MHDPFTGIELPTFLIQNEAAARATGVELGLTFAPDSHWLFNFDLGTLHTYYTEILPGATNEITLGSKFGQAPRLQYSAGAQYGMKIWGDYSILARVDDNFTSGYDRSYVPGDQSTTYTGDTWEQHSFALVAGAVDAEIAQRQVGVVGFRDQPAQQDLPDGRLLQSASAGGRRHYRPAA